MGLCPSTLFCSFISRVKGLDLSLLVFHGEKQFKNLWLYQVGKTKGFESFQ